MGDKLTEKELKQRQDAAKKHGIYSYRDRGSQALDPQGRSRLQEISEQMRSRQGVEAMLQERASHAVMLVELATAYVAEQHEAGTPLDQIAVFKSLPAFMNSAHRQIRALLDVMPAEIGESAELQRIRKVIDAA